jgi:hypothetical protein
MMVGVGHAISAVEERAHQAEITIASLNGAWGSLVAAKQHAEEQMRAAQVTYICMWVFDHYRARC